MSLTACVHVHFLNYALTGEFGIVYKGYIVKDSALDIAAIKTLKGIGHYNFIQCIIF